jgi:K+-sensing histidine kinase KdpD
MPDTGKLKVFLGMCPGVGKTYAMLQAAANSGGKAWMSSPA